MDFKRTLGMAFAAVGFSLAAAPAVTDNPYGVCAHVSRGELDIAPQEFKRMHEADINWVRTDFDWHGVEPKQGAWDFSRLDKLIPLAKQANVSILPILDYDVPWALRPGGIPMRGAATSAGSCRVTRRICGTGRSGTSRTAAASGETGRAARTMFRC